jgi:hypothetical protein
MEIVGELIAMSGVGTRVVFEDDRIKVWELELDPGQKTAVHTHEMDYVFYVMNGSSLEILDEENNSLGVFEYDDGDVMPLRLEGEVLVGAGDESLRVPATHAARNVGDTPYREILIEKK